MDLELPCTRFPLKFSLHGCEPCCPVGGRQLLSMASPMTQMLWGPLIAAGPLTSQGGTRLAQEGHDAADSKAGCALQ